MAVEDAQRATLLNLFYLVFLAREPSQPRIGSEPCVRGAGLVLLGRRWVELAGNVLA